MAGWPGGLGGWQRWCAPRPAPPGDAWFCLRAAGTPGGAPCPATELWSILGLQRPEVVESRAAWLPFMHLLGNGQKLSPLSSSGGLQL